MKTVMKPAENVKREILPLGFKDKQGRTVGVFVVTSERDFVEPDDGKDKYFVGYDVEAGRYYEACIQVARNDTWYGSGRYREMFKTEAERDAYVAEKIEAVKKTQFKKFGINQ
jgi:hypothetical protein